VVRVTADDWADLRAVRLRALADAPSAFSSSYDREAAWPDDQWQTWAADSERGERQATFWALDQADPIGMVFAVVADANTVNLHGLWVDPGSRNADVGAALCSAVIRWAEEHRRPRVRLHVAEANEPARGLYRKLGFTSTARARRPQSDDSVRHLEMVRVGQPG
jgi:ribosomal protein S18 acetylase RimI-like enzyme